MLKAYFKVFILIYTGYSLLNWFIGTRFIVRINVSILDFWIPGIVCFGLTYRYLRPIVKTLNYTEKTAEFLLWAAMPFTMMIPIAFSQSYFRDSSYKIVQINSPKELTQNLHERFFKIGHFQVDSEAYFLLRERHTSGRYGTTLNVSNYYVVPIYNDSIEMNNTSQSTVAYCISFSTQMSNGLIQKKEQPEKIKIFNAQSSKNFKDFDFHKVGYFEKIVNTDDVKYFSQAIKYSFHFSSNKECLMLINRNGTVEDLYRKDRNLALFGSLISLLFGVISIKMSDTFYRKKHSN